MSEKLRECPFCGQAPSVYEQGGGRLDGSPRFYTIACWNVYCLYRPSPGHASGTEAEAIAAWNTRSPGWISVKERLPGEEENVMWIHAPVVEPPWIGSQLDGDYPTDGWFTHWLPLPECPKEESDA